MRRSKQINQLDTQARRCAGRLRIRMSLVIVVVGTTAGCRPVLCAMIKQRGAPLQRVQREPGHRRIAALVGSDSLAAPERAKLVAVARISPRPSSAESSCAMLRAP